MANQSKSLLNSNLESQFSAKLASIKGMDHYRLRFKSTPCTLPGALRAHIDDLYRLTNAKVLAATILDAILSFQQSAFLLSRKDCQRLIEGNHRILQKFNVLGSGPHSAYQGMIKELSESTGVLRFTVVHEKKPAVVEVIDPLLLSLIGESDSNWYENVYRSVGSSRSSVNQSLRNTDAQASGNSVVQTSSDSDVQSLSSSVIQGFLSQDVSQALSQAEPVSVATESSPFPPGFFDIKRPVGSHE